jgi:hypothetical protein
MVEACLCIMPHLKHQPCQPVRRKAIFARRLPLSALGFGVGTQNAPSLQVAALVILAKKTSLDEALAAIWIRDA